MKACEVLSSLANYKLWFFVMYHSFDVEHAKKYGVIEAILLQNIGFWIIKNMANKKHEHEGSYWTYNSYPAFHGLFPYLSEKQVRSALVGLESHKVLKSGNFNSAPYDRTKWYAIVDETVLRSFTEHLTKTEDPSALQGAPIPVINTDRKQIQIQESSELEEIITYWNTVYETKYRSITGLLSNYNGARKSYSVDEIKAAIDNIKNHPFWKDKMTPTILFRKKNPQGEPVDYVGSLLSWKEKKAYTYMN